MSDDTDDIDIRDEHLGDEDLVAAARTLGVRAADQLDMARTARGVVARWRAEQVRRARPIVTTPSFLRIAAAVVLIFAGIETWEHRYQPVRAALEPADAGLEGLSTEQLQAILPDVDRQATIVEVTASDAGLEGLTPDELRSLLASMGS